MQLSNNLVSIVMPVYKAEKIVAEIIRAMQAQSYQNWQLSVVDDGSPYEITHAVVVLAKSNPLPHHQWRGIAQQGEVGAHGVEPLLGHRETERLLGLGAFRTLCAERVAQVQGLPICAS